MTVEQVKSGQTVLFLWGGIPDHGALESSAVKIKEKVGSDGFLQVENESILLQCKLVRTLVCIHHIHKHISRNLCVEFKNSYIVNLNILNQRLPSLQNYFCHKVALDM